MELCMVGLHAPSMGGIDYMHVKGKRGSGEAISIVSSGEYEDDAEDEDVLIYTGQGGNLGIGFDMRKDKEVHDQKLVRGNLALDRSSQIGNEIRVVRGIKESVNSGTKVYVYDGLYRIHEKWLEKTKSGVNSFKYKFVRSQGQPSAFAVWQSVQMWKAGTASRPGLILPDLTCGAESTPVSLVNDIDGEKGPSHFTYLSTVRYPNTFNLAQPFSGCSCQKECSADDLNCSCICRNGGDFPYTTNGVLVSRKPLVYECGPSCLCSPNCKNRVSQTGLKVRLEVFKTKDRGWAVRSWDPIRSGTFICEFSGDVIDQPRSDGNEGVNYDFVFDSTRTTDRPFKWNYDAVLTGEEAQGESNEEYNIPFSLVISAGDAGNTSYQRMGLGYSVWFTKGYALTKHILWQRFWLLEYFDGSEGVS
ncbi:Histone-lysine N-methyltransferase, H3 lysine-9 specific SUVH3-like protein [Drosera capensis]